MQAAKALFYLGCAIAVGGLGGAVFQLLDRAIATRPLLSAPLSPHGEFQSPPLEIGSVPLAEARVVLEVRSRYYSRTFRSGDGVDLYRIPVQYRLVDAGGEVLHSQWHVLDAAESLLVRPERWRKQWSSSRRVEARFDPFVPPKGGPVRLEVSLVPDELHAAQVEQARVELSRRYPPLLPALSESLLLALAGGLVMILGLLRALRPPRRPLPRVEPAAVQRPLRARELQARAA